MHRKTTRATALAAVLSLSAAGLGEAITFGEPDGNAHPHVGTLLFVQNGEGYFSCTGTLISPTVMLTAGHCTEGGGVENSETWVRFDENALEGIDQFDDIDDWLADRWIPATDVIPHPQFADFATFPDTFDVGLVILSQAVTLPVYGQLPARGLLEQVLAKKGNKNNWWTAVGYGVQGILKPFEQDDFARYRTTARLIELTGTNNGSGHSAKFTNNPGGGKGGTCFGDSGGPIFYQNTTIIGAVTSWGITPCIGVDYQFRIDTALALDFINANVP